ncbi:MAG TPA: DUF362 domain-containing protein [Armatimonadota bacterium]|nr:DUF362 domain-containing protein [Armatimonadota bacterium]
MSVDVFFASPRQKALRAEETLPSKLDLILDRLHIRDRVKDELVAIKMHLGYNIGYSTVHPVFVRKVVQAVKDGGGQPFVTDSAGSALNAHTRGYTNETLGCPILPTHGANEKYVYPIAREYKSIKEWQVGGHLHDATFLIDLAHAKGHPSCGFGGCFKNLALGGMAWPTRSAIHDVMHFDRYWFADRCPSQEQRQAIIASCPSGSIVQDREAETELHIHFDPCNQCGRCLRVAPEGSLRIAPVNFHSFQEAMAHSVDLVLGTFDRNKQVFINIATQITPVCDCFGFTGPAVLPDAGIFASNDIVAVEQAVLDALGRSKLIVENVPDCMEVQPGAGPHPIQQLHGPYKDPYVVVRKGQELGLGVPDYQLVNVMDGEEAPSLADQTTISAGGA